ncbi:MAG: sulfatase-like hydrolase/transferase [Verrucomicrobiota bacterium JB024]|nr:sulfatase-like hydrolase/transferase [Verrucomicrobiota bacterium JB024]
MSFFYRFLTRYLALALFLLIVQACGYLFVPTSLFYMSDLMDGFIVLFVLKEFFLTNIVALVLALPVAAVAQWRGGKSRAAVGMSIVAVLVGGILVGGSWGQYNTAGIFATVSSYEMALTNPVLVALHAFHFQPMLVSVSLVVLALILAVGVWYVVRSEDIKNKSLARSCALLLFLSAVVADWFTFSGSRVGVEDTRTFQSTSFGRVTVIQDFLEQCYESRTGPLTTLYCDWANQRELLSSLSPHPKIRAEHPPLTTPEEWARGAPSGRRLNVLFLVVESLRCDVIYEEGKFREIMPNVAQLAREGAFFTDYYTLATHSNYADIVPISSQYPLRSVRTHVYPEQPGYPTPRIYDLLKTQGYRTAIISSQNESWGGMINYLSSPSLDYFFHAPALRTEGYEPKDDNGDPIDIGVGLNELRFGKVDDRYTVNEAIHWIKQDRQTPFYIYSNFQNSHFPYSVPEGFPRPYAPEPEMPRLALNSVPPQYMDLVRRRYYDSLHYIDSQIGRLIQSLKDAGRWDDTLVIVTGDTAQAFGEHGFSGHATMLFDETLRTPLIIHGPGIEPEVVTQRYSHLDVAPTILGQLGLPPYPGFQGMDAMDREHYDPDRLIFLVVQSPLCRQYGVLFRGVKFFTDEITGADYFYQIDLDPGEERNIAYAAPQLSAELHQMVDAWLYYQLSYYTDAKQRAVSFPPVLTWDSNAGASPPPANPTDQ